MPVMRNRTEKPDWVRWSNFGFARLESADQLRRHYHDADEYWLVYSGRARVLSEEIEYELGPGDILCTRMGDEHDVLEVLEAPFECIWIEDVLRGQKRPGHLYRNNEHEDAR
jgi:mannose-6-phosphate isomerase-like protein (cupin superfamily)